MILDWTKRRQIELDKLAIRWLNISRDTAIVTRPDTCIPQTLSCGPLDARPAVRAAPDYCPDR